MRIKPFTGTNAYRYLHSFFTGLDLESIFRGPNGCGNSLTRVIDDMIHIYNNATVLNWSTDFEKPFLQFSDSVHSNMMDSVIDCYVMGINGANYGINRYAEFNSDVWEMID